MKVSLDWAQYYSNVSLIPEGGVDELVRKIGAQLGAVEEVVDLGQKYQGIIIAKVMSCDKHPNADKLSICKVDDGGKAQNVDRDENSHVQVVCGAPNVREGLTVAWLPPRATVPSTHDKDPFVLEAREIRGQMSNGMLASAHELGISDDHSGIVELDEGNPGDDFAEVFGLNDYIIDIENKMFTHRPDCFGQLGVAREIAGINGREFQSPDWYLSPDSRFQIPDSKLPLEVKNELPDLVPRFTAIAIRDVEIKPSPFWLQTYLSRVGIRPINNIVDLTNYFMILTGQPLHAYDYDKLRALDNSDHATINVRHPYEGEKIVLLGGKEITPRPEAIMIASATKLIGVGGIMGGTETEVDENTKNIVLECASFDLYSIRRTSMQHGLFTDAVTRFTKGQSPLQNDRIAAKTVDDILKLAGGQIASDFIDIKGDLPAHTEVETTSDFINLRLGTDLSADQIAQLLTNVEFEASAEGANLRIKAPFWRRDIHIPEDIVEEIGRLHGYDNLPIVLPKRSIRPATRDQLLDFKTKVREHLAAAGANEVLTYSFVHGNLLDKTGQDQEKAFRIANALSPDLQYYRLSLTPSLLEKVHANIKSGQGEFAMFEIGKVHAKGLMDEDVPREFNRLSLVFAADDKTAREYQGAAFYQARRYLTQLLEAFGKANMTIQPLAGSDLGGHFLIEQMTKPFDPDRSAVLVKDDLVVGVVGEYRSGVAKALKLPAFTAGFETFHSFLLSETGQSPYIPLSRFPKVEQDICLEVRSDLGYQSLFDFVHSKVQELKPKDTSLQLTPVDIYQKDESAKRTTLRLTISSHDRTLMAEEVNRLLDTVAGAAKETLDAKRI